MFSNLTGTHAVVILAVVLLLFGAAKLPALARSLGQSVRILKDEAGDDTDKNTAAATAATADTPVIPTVPYSPVAPTTTTDEIERRAA